MIATCEHHDWLATLAETGPEHYCLACGAEGDDCPDCDGIGALDDDEFEGSIEVACPTCGGRGIVARTAEHHQEVFI